MWETQSPSNPPIRKEFPEHGGDLARPQTPAKISLYMIEWGEHRGLQFALFGGWLATDGDDPHDVCEVMVDLREEIQHH